MAKTKKQYKPKKKIQKYPHFDPKEHKIETKMASVKSGRHCKFNINYHIIWIPKYRKHVLFGKVAEVLKTIIEGVCLDNGCENLALEIMPNHIHLFVGAKPTINPANLIKLIKGNTSKQLRQAIPDLKYLGYEKHYKRFDNLWARGYYCGTAGHVSQEQVRRYILEQEGKSVFEYDIYGCPDKLKGQLTIGDFTNG